MVLSRFYSGSGGIRDSDRRIFGLFRCEIHLQYNKTIKRFKKKTMINLLQNSKRLVMMFLGYVPVVSNLVFKSPLEIIECETKRGMLEYIKGMKSSQRNSLHFGYGMNIRNDYLLWHPNNPYTIKRLKTVPTERQYDSPFHPDNLSWSIISRLIVASGNRIRDSIDISENITYALLLKDDSPDNLDELRQHIKSLVDSESFDLINSIFAECIQINPSKEKLKILLGEVAGNDSEISPINYLEIAKRAISSELEI